MHARAHDPVFDSDLPLVRNALPWPVRLLCGAMGLFALVMPAWEWHHALWPPQVASLLLLAMVVAIGAVGVRFVAFGLSGAAEDWRYVPGAVLVRRRAWGRETQLRLSMANVAGVRIIAPDNHASSDAEWRVHLVPNPNFSHLATETRGRGVFDAGGFGSAAYAERVRRALALHLGLESVGPGPDAHRA